MPGINRDPNNNEWFFMDEAGQVLPQVGPSRNTEGAQQLRPLVEGQAVFGSSPSSEVQLRSQEHINRMVRINELREELSELSSVDEPDEDDEEQIENISEQIEILERENAIGNIRNERPPTIQNNRSPFEYMSVFDTIPASRDEHENHQEQRLARERTAADRLRKMREGFLEKIASSNFTLTWENYNFYNSSTEKSDTTKVPYLLEMDTIGSPIQHVYPPNIDNVIEQVVTDSSIPKDKKHQAIEEQLLLDLTKYVGEMKKDKKACVSCGKQKEEDDLNSIKGKKWCEECEDAYFESCGHCGKSETIGEMLEVAEGHLACSNCMKDYADCSRCKGKYSIHNMMQDPVSKKKALTCSRCLNNPNAYPEGKDRIQTARKQHTTDVARRSWPKGKNYYQSTDNGKIISTQRKFSAEIECIFPNTRVASKVTHELLPIEMGVAGDGSISTDGMGDGGVELQTPQLQGKRGEDLIFEVCNTLNEHDFKVNKSCGLHIHLDGGNKFTRVNRKTGNSMPLKSLWMFHIAFEDVLMSFLPKDRRTNRYCRSLKEGYHIAEINHAYNIQELEKIWYRATNHETVRDVKGNRYTDSRYTGINLHSLIAFNHMEVRYHSGTLNPVKILEWVNLHATIMDIAEAGLINFDVILRAQAYLTVEERTEFFFTFLKLPKHTEEYLRDRQKKFLVKDSPMETDMVVDYTNDKQEKLCAA